MTCPSRPQWGQCPQRRAPAWFQRNPQGQHRISGDHSHPARLNSSPPQCIPPDSAYVRPPPSRSPHAHTHHCLPSLRPFRPPNIRSVGIRRCNSASCPELLLTCCMRVSLLGVQGCWSDDLLLWLVSVSVCSWFATGCRILGPLTLRLLSVPVPPLT